MSTPRVNYLPYSPPPLTFDSGITDSYDNLFEASEVVEGLRFLCL